MQAFPRTLGSALHTTLSAALLPLLLLCTSPAAHAQTRPQDITPGTVSPTGPGAVISGGDRSTGSNTPGNNNNSDSSCWVWVDEDWQSTPGTVIVGGVAGVDKGPHVAARTTPFNSVMGDSSTEYATLCAGSGWRSRRDGGRAPPKRTLPGRRRTLHLQQPCRGPTPGPCTGSTLRSIGQRAHHHCPPDQPRYIWLAAPVQYAQPAINSGVTSLPAAHRRPPNALSSARGRAIGLQTQTLQPAPP